jgi:hypothetical protein
MAEQLPLPAAPSNQLPPLAISDGALLKFSREMNTQLVSFIRQFAEPRRHPRVDFQLSRFAPRKPR